MTTAPLILASYPRSGSTFLRWLLTACDYEPKQKLSYAYVNSRFPTIESESEMKTAQNVLGYKTHQQRTGDNIVHLVRHVGDVLISEYHFMRKFGTYKKSLPEFLVEMEYGKNWRNFVEHYFGYRYISYENINTYYKLGSLFEFLNFQFPEQAALLSNKFNLYKPKTYKEVEAYLEFVTSVEAMRKAEKKGFGELGNPNKHINFVREARSGQWTELPQPLQDKILAYNERHLKLYGYA